MVVAICYHGWTCCETVHTSSCEGLRFAFLHCDVVILNMTPIEELDEAQGNGGLAAANRRNGNQKHISLRSVARNLAVLYLLANDVRAFQTLRGEKVFAQLDNTMICLIGLPKPWILM